MNNVGNGAVSKELEAMKDRNKEGKTSSKSNFSPYWVVLVFLASLALAICFIR